MAKFTTFPRALGCLSVTLPVLSPSPLHLWEESVWYLWPQSVNRDQGGHRKASEWPFFWALYVEFYSSNKWKVTMQIVAHGFQKKKKDNQCLQTFLNWIYRCMRTHTHQTHNKVDPNLPNDVQLTAQSGSTQLYLITVSRRWNVRQCERPLRFVNRDPFWVAWDPSTGVPLQ